MRLKTTTNRCWKDRTNLQSFRPSLNFDPLGFRSLRACHFGTTWSSSLCHFSRFKTQFCHLRPRSCFATVGACPAGVGRSWATLHSTTSAVGWANPRGSSCSARDQMVLCRWRFLLNSNTHAHGLGLVLWGSITHTGLLSTHVL